MAAKRLPRICNVVGCDKRRDSRGFCKSHADRFRRYGDPLAGRTFKGEPLQWIKDHASYTGDDCIPWPFAIGKLGYGVMVYRGKRRVASRVMCIIAHGEPPTKKYEAAHSCGNGHIGCMNPQHLRWATKLENHHDKIAHGTRARGETVNGAKLNREQVLKIRSLEGRFTQAKIGQMFGIGQTQVGFIFKRKSWAWLD